jgi:hypothetical protein
VADSDSTGTDFEPGTNDEDQHGWAPDVPGTGEAKDQAIAGHKRAFKGSGTQDEATGVAAQGPDLTGGHVGQRATSRSEDALEREGKEPGRSSGPPQGESERAAGSSTARDSTGVDPQQAVDDGSPPPAERRPGRLTNREPIMAGPTPGRHARRRR